MVVERPPLGEPQGPVRLRVGLSVVPGPPSSLKVGGEGMAALATKDILLGALRCDMHSILCDMRSRASCSHAHCSAAAMPTQGLLAG